MKRWKAAATVLFFSALAACAKTEAPPSNPPPAVASAPDAPTSPAAPTAPTPQAPRGETPMPAKPDVASDQVVHTEAEWKKLLTPEQYRVMREKGTERPFTGKYWETTTPGVYKCAACGAALFESDAKFEAGCGWPSFFKPLPDAKIVETRDESFGMVRTEVTCGRCGAHLGHLFDDGPPPTHLRYCINSVSIDLTPKTDAKKEPEKPAK